jgi:hypothetical protein
MLQGTVFRAKDVLLRLHAVADDLATTMNARRGQELNRTLEAIEKVLFARDPNFKGLRTSVSTKVAVDGHGV